MPIDHNTNIITGGKWYMLSVQSDPIINVSMHSVESDIVSLDSTTFAVFVDGISYSPSFTVSSMIESSCMPSSVD